MDIYSKLPEELRNTTFYHLSHPRADMIRDRVEKLRLNRVISIEGLLENLELDCKMRDLFMTEHLLN